MGTYSDLLNKIKLFSETKFKGVYTRPFAKHVILDSHNPKTQDFAIVYCDFNRLNDINSIYSENIGDEILSTTFSRIQTILNTYFSQSQYSISIIGGDEFFIMFDNSNLETLKTCFKEIYSVLHKDSLFFLEEKYTSDELYKHIPQFVDFSYGIVHSKEENFSEINDMLYEAELRESHYKLFAETSHLSFEDSLALMTENSLAKFFKNFRLDNYISFDLKENINSENYSNKREIRNILSTSIHCTLKLLSHPDEINQLLAKLTELGVSPKAVNSFLLSKEQCNEIYSYIQNSDEDVTYLNNFNTNDLSSFLNTLIREPVSGCYNKKYLQHYFSNAFLNSDIDFSTAILVDTTHMKDSNLKLGHSATDRNLKLFSNRIQNELEFYSDVSFSKNNFHIDSNQNYIFDLGGGDYFILLKEEIPSNDLTKIVEHCISDCTPLGAVYSKENINGRKDVLPIINHLFTTCRQKKNALKNQHLNFSDDNVIETFEMFLSPSLQYYLENHPSNPLDMNELKKFMDILSTAVINQASRCIQNYNNQHKSPHDNYFEI